MTFYGHVLWIFNFLLLIIFFIFSQNLLILIFKLSFKMIFLFQVALRMNHIQIKKYPLSSYQHEPSLQETVATKLENLQRTVHFN